MIAENTKIGNKEKVAAKRNTPSKILEQFFDTKNMVFYRRDIESIVVFLLPYHIKKQDIQFDIKISVIDERGMCRMSFSCELNEDKDYSKELLYMNSELIKGRLSVEKDSNQVTYSTNFILENQSDVETLYNENLNLCLTILANLYKNGIVKEQEKTIYEDK